MRLATYTGTRESLFNADEPIEVHLKAKLRTSSGLKYLVKKHKELGGYPYANLTVVKESEIYTDNTLDDYHRNRNFVWMPPEDFEFHTNNISMKHVLTKLEE